jgi:urease accessory protein UreH
MLLLGEVLAPSAPSDEFFSITQGCGPVESSSESLADQHTRRRVVAGDAFVDLLQDVLAFFSGAHFMSTPEVVPRL